MARRAMALVGLLGVAIVALTGCGTKGLEGFQDAPIGDRLNTPALVGEMPDGFSNFAAVCEGPNRVYTLFHGDSAYGGIAVAPNDPRCVK